MNYEEKLNYDAKLRKSLINISFSLDKGDYSDIELDYILRQPFISDIFTEHTNPFGKYVTFLKQVQSILKERSIPNTELVSIAKNTELTPFSDSRCEIS
jgi:hypothetical protein